MTFSVFSNPPSYLSSMAASAQCIFSVLMCIGHLSSLLHGSPHFEAFCPVAPVNPPISVSKCTLLFWKELSLYPTKLHSPSLCEDCLIYCIHFGRIVSDGSITLVLIDYPSISLDRDLNSHRSRIQEFPDI